MRVKFSKQQFLTVLKETTWKEWIGCFWLLATFIYIMANQLYITGIDSVDYDVVNSVTHVDTVNIGKIVLLFFAYCGSIFCIRWKNNLTEQKEKQLILAITFGSPFLTFTLLELSYQSDYITMHPVAFLLNMLILGFCTWLFAALCNRFRPAVLIPATVWMIYGFANIYVLRFRGFALLLTDFLQIGTALEVAESYDYTLTYSMVVMLIALVDYYIIVCKLKNIRYFGKKKRAAAIGSIPVLSILCYLIVVKSNIITDNGMKINQYKPQKSYKSMGTSLTIVGSARFLTLEKPKNYTEETLADLTSKYTSDRADAVNAADSPDLIIIMDESFTDFAKLYKLDTSEDPLPFFHSLSENVVDGTMYVTGFGGQTANTEYEFLTGNSMAFLSAGVVPYQSYLKSDTPHTSLTRNFESMGYEDSLAIHSFGKTGYNRIASYNALGFDTFLGMEDFSEPRSYRKFISDQSHFEKIIEVYEEHKDEDSPLFCFNVTMQNHSSYNKIYPNFNLDITVNDLLYKDRTDIQTFVNLMKKTDEAYEYLISYFEQQKDPVMIVFFGDHQPNIKVKRKKKVALQKYQVPFKIWTNYDIEEQHLDQISPNYLGAFVTELSGGALTGYQKFLLDLYKEIPALTQNGYIGDDGVLYEVDDETSPYYERLKEYEILQYNNLFDKEHTIDEFFYLQDE